MTLRLELAEVDPLACPRCGEGRLVERIGPECYCAVCACTFRTVTRFDRIVEHLRPLALELCTTPVADRDEHMVKGMLCLLMWYAEDMTPAQRTVFGDGLARAMLDLAERIGTVDRVRFN